MKRHSEEFLTIINFIIKYCIISVFLTWLSVIVLAVKTAMVRVHLVLRNHLIFIVC